MFAPLLKEINVHICPHCHFSNTLLPNEDKDLECFECGCVVIKKEPEIRKGRVTVVT